MRCPNCGETFKIKKGKSLNFCGFCGTNLKTGEKSWTVNETSAPSIPLNTRIEEFKSENLTVNTPDVPKYDNVIRSTEINPALSSGNAENNDSSSVSANVNREVTFTKSTDKSVIVPPPFEEANTKVDLESVFEPADSETELAFSNIGNSTDDMNEISKSVKELENTPFGNGKYGTPIKSAISTDEAAYTIPKEEPVKETSGNGITYMEYTGSNKEIVEKSVEDNSPENDFSAFAFSKPAVSPVNEDDLKFIDNNNSKPGIENLEDILPPSSENLEELAPAPEPEPEKEKIIDYVGQDKSIAENTLKFKGMDVEIIYVTDEHEYDTIIEQSVEPDSEVVVGTHITLTVSAGTWSEWSENAQQKSNNNYITETMTQSRKRSRTRTIDKRQTTDTSEYPDYTLVDTIHRYSEWEVDQYHTPENIPVSDTVEVMSKSIGFKYSGWFNPANMTAISFSTPDVANFFNSNLSNVKWIYEEVILDQNIKPDVKNWRLAHDSMTKSPAGDPITSNIFFSSHVINGKAYAMKSGTAETQWFIYRRRTLEETMYYFEKEIISDWSEWSEWSEQTYTVSDDCEVETRTLTRSRRKTTAEKQN